ncbi:hypothetical protein DXG03_005624 [Asterophora parasitica]|uniref:Uncharacterized protein n=1 Tax=Asterophora parasitica TaxID=117018 RepID=A0A9P7GBE5_9AGAR|nr:hypothetical protein DXG03_005624 [Asterophora parasitica]
MEAAAFSKDHSSHGAVGSFVYKGRVRVVKGHAILLSNGIRHGNPSLPNIAYDPTTERGLDFNLSIPERPHPCVVGSLPFIAVDPSLRVWTAEGDGGHAGENRLEWALARCLQWMAHKTHDKAIGNPFHFDDPVPPVIPTLQDMWIEILALLNARHERVGGFGYLGPVKDLDDAGVREAVV